MNVYQLLMTACCLTAVSAAATGSDGFFKIRSSLHKRTNGALLTAETSLSDEGPKDGKAINISWVIDYTGPRQPLHILKPTVQLGTYGQTVVTFYSKGKEFRVASPAAAGKYYPRESWFGATPAGETMNGDILIPVSQLKKYYRAKWPKEFDAQRPPAIHMQFTHAPTDRGRNFSLDAWTGELYTPVMKVELEEW